MIDRSHDDAGADRSALPDDQLLAAVRSGDTGAYAVLYQRHLGAAMALVRRLGGRYDPGEVVQEAFLGVLQAVLRGGGPREGFAGYLMRTVRNEVIDRSRRAREIAVEDIEAVDPDAMMVSDGSEEVCDRELLQRALRTLPTAWQRILWLTEVEGRTPREVAPLLDQSPNAVAQLSRRAREGLRTAWLQAHVDVASASQGCREVAGMLGAYERGQLRAARASRVEAHLATCSRCRSALAQLREVSSRMRGLLLPLVLASPLLLEVAMPDTLARPAAALAIQSASVPAHGTVNGGLAVTGQGVGRWVGWKAAAAMNGWSVAVTGAAAAVTAATLVLAALLPYGADGWDTEEEAPGGPVSAAPPSAGARPLAPRVSGTPATTDVPVPAPTSAEDDAPRTATAPATERAREPDSPPATAAPSASEAPPTAAPTVATEPPAPRTSPRPSAPPTSREPERQPASPSAPVLHPHQPAPPQGTTPTEEPTPLRDPAPSPTQEAHRPAPVEQPSTPVALTPTEDPTPTEATVPMPTESPHPAPTSTPGPTSTEPPTEEPTASGAPEPSPTREPEPIPAPTTDPPQLPDPVPASPTDRAELDVLPAPELRAPAAGATIPANIFHGDRSGAWLVLEIDVAAGQAYTVLIDGRRWDLPALPEGTTARHLALLSSGEHTLELAHRDPVTGRLGAVRTATLTVV